MKGQKVQKDLRKKNKSRNYVNRFHIERNLEDEDLSLKVPFDLG